MIVGAAGVAVPLALRVSSGQYLLFNALQKADYSLKEKEKASTDRSRKVSAEDRREKRNPDKCEMKRIHRQMKKIFDFNHVIRVPLP